MKQTDQDTSRVSAVAGAGHVRRVLAGLTALVLVAACGNDGDGTAAADDRPTVVATTGIWADVVANVACNDVVDVTTIIPSGADPHAFEPSLRDRERLDGADLVVANGLDLEEGLVDTLEAVADAGTPVLEVSDFVVTLSAGASEGREGEAHDEDHVGEDHDDHVGDDHDDHDGDDHHHDHGGADPHIWLDPTRVAGALPAIADALVATAGVDRAAIDECLAGYEAELRTLDQELVDLFSELPDDRRKLVTNHDALSYLADRYGFQVIGTVIPAPSTLAEASPAQLETLAGLIDSEGVAAIFAEAQHSTADSEALARRVGDVEVVTLFTGALGEPDSGAETYVGLLRENARLIVAGLR